MRKEVFCSSCGTSNSAKLKGEGFLTLPCSKCRYPIRDMDNYFDVVYNGIHIPDNKERFLFAAIGTLVCVVLFLCYAAWVTAATVSLASYPIHHTLEFVKMVLIFVGVPYLLYKRVDKLIH